MNQNQECNREKDEKRSTTFEIQPPPPYPTRDYGQVRTHYGWWMAIEFLTKISY